MTTYTFHIGATVTMAIDAVQGDVGSVSAITAAMRRLAPGRKRFDPDAGPIVVTVAARAAAGDVPAGWNLTLAAAASADLSSGHYGMDARLTVGGGVIVTDFVTVRMMESA